MMARGGRENGAQRRHPFRITQQFVRYGIHQQPQEWAFLLIINDSKESTSSGPRATSRATSCPTKAGGIGRTAGKNGFKSFISNTESGGAVVPYGHNLGKPVERPSVTIFHLPFHLEHLPLPPGTPTLNRTFPVHTLRSRWTHSTSTWHTRHKQNHPCSSAPFQVAANFFHRERQPTIDNARTGPSVPGTKPSTQPGTMPNTQPNIQPNTKPNDKPFKKPSRPLLPFPPHSQGNICIFRNNLLPLRPIDEKNLDLLYPYLKTS